MESEASQAELKALRAAISTGLKSGAGVPAEKVFAELRARYSQRVDHTAR